MRKIMILAGALTALAVPTAAQAHDKDTKAHAAAVKACRAERGTTDATRQAFADKYGTNHNKRNAFGKCVSQKVRAAKQAQAGDDDATPTPKPEPRGDDHGDRHGHGNGNGNCH